MKQYIIFCYLSYYPSGGWNDFHSSHETLDEASEELIKLKLSKNYDYGQVVDLEQNAVVESFSR